MKNMVVGMLYMRDLGMGMGMIIIYLGCWIGLRISPFRLVGHIGVFLIMAIIITICHLIPANKFPTLRLTSTTIP